MTIGFCGQITKERKQYLDILSKSDINCDFIFRKGYWAPGMDKQKAREEFYENIESNLFAFCYRGCGNFSYRFYQIMSMGRIPILINTNTVIPFWDEIICKHNIGIIIDEKDIKSKKKDIIIEIKEYYNKNDLFEIQKNNRKLYEKYFSPSGFLENITKFYLR